MAVLQRALRHFACRFLAHRAAALKRCWVHTQQFDLGAVAVGDEAPLEAGGAAGDSSHELRGHAARAGFGERQHPAALGEGGAKLGRQGYQWIVSHSHAYRVNKV